MKRKKFSIFLCIALALANFSVVNITAMKNNGPKKKFVFEYEGVQAKSSKEKLRELRSFLLTCRNVESFYRDIFRENAVFEKNNKCNERVIELLKNIEKPIEEIIDKINLYLEKSENLNSGEEIDTRSMEEIDTSSTKNNHNSYFESDEIRERFDSSNLKINCLVSFLSECCDLKRFSSSVADSKEVFENRELNECLKSLKDPVQEVSTKVKLYYKDWLNSMLRVSKKYFYAKLSYHMLMIYYDEQFRYLKHGMITKDRAEEIKSIVELNSNNGVSSKEDYRRLTANCDKDSYFGCDEGCKLFMRKISVFMKKMLELTDDGGTVNEFMVFLDRAKKELQRFLGIPDSLGQQSQLGDLQITENDLQKIKQVLISSTLSSEEKKEFEYELKKFEEEISEFVREVERKYDITLALKMDLRNLSGGKVSEKIVLEGRL